MPHFKDFLYLLVVLTGCTSHMWSLQHSLDPPNRHIYKSASDLHLLTLANEARVRLRHLLSQGRNRGRLISTPPLATSVLSHLRDDKNVPYFNLEVFCGSAKNITNISLHKDCLKWWQAFFIHGGRCPTRHHPVSTSRFAVIRGYNKNLQSKTPQCFCTETNTSVFLWTEASQCCSECGAF